MIVTIHQKVSIEPKYLDSNISYHILKRIRYVMENTCTLKYGYIISVNKIINLGSNIIAPANSLVIYDVTYEAETLLPHSGLVINGNVCMIFENGILVDIYGKTQVLVPSENMNGFEFSNNSFIHSTKNKISIGSNVIVKITMVKYEKKEFKCIGKLKL